MEKDARIYVAGHTGMVGSAIVRKLQSEGFDNLVLKTREELDLLDQRAVEGFYEEAKPEYVLVAAAKVGGIKANNERRAEFIYENLQIQSNLIHQAYSHTVKKLLFLGSSCIYPRSSPQPMKEEYLLTGELEPTNEPYALAKIAGIKMCESYYRQYGCQFFSLMPTNAYGPHDNFDLETAHVLPALMRKIHEAKVSDAREVIVWGSGKPRREFIHVDDIALACLFIMEREFSEFYDKGLIHLNVGTGSDISIQDLVNLLTETIGFSGKVKYDKSMPDGMPRKLLDVSRINELGWHHSISLKEGIQATYDWYIKNCKQYGTPLEKSPTTFS